MEEMKDFEEMIEGKYPRLSLYEIAEIFQLYTILTESRKTSNEYGDGEKYTAIEAHMMNYIDDHPGCTVTEIARKWNRSQSSVSQIVRKLKKRELLYFVENEDNATIRNMYLTEKGKRATFYHKRFDRYVWHRMLNHLLEKFPPEDLNIAFHVIAELNEHVSGQKFTMKEWLRRFIAEEETDSKNV